MTPAPDPHNEESLRLFVAIEPPTEWIAVLQAAQQRLRDAGLRLRYARPEGMHLTLKFLGETPPTRVSAIEAALRRTAATAWSMRLELGGTGTFGSVRRPRVVWCGVGGETVVLGALHSLMDTALDEAGFPRDARMFRPHLTLARVPERIDPVEAARIAGLVAALELSAAPFVAHSVVLVRSVLGRGGAQYEVLARYPLLHDRTN